MARVGKRAVICCLALVACNFKSRAPAPAIPPPMTYDPTAAVVVTSTGASAARPMPSPEASLQPSRQLIRRGRIDVRVSSLDDARARLERSAGALAAQVARATIEQRDRAEFFIRVPPERLDALMDSVAALGDVESRSVGVEDVTERVIDAEARLVSLRASRDRLRQLLERAATVPDVISVERELARIQAEIESLEARLTALRGQVAMSELSVTLRQRAVLGPLGLVAAGVGTVVKKLFVWR